MVKRGLGREEIHEAAWGESYPHPLISCLMPGVAILAIMALLLVGISTWQKAQPRDTTIPLVEGNKAEDAEKQLEQAGLKAEVAPQQQASETVPAGAVIKQEPLAGQHVKVGRVIRLIVSAGSAFTNVPDVRELSEGSARERLSLAGLVIGSEEYANHATIPFDRIIDMTPAPGQKVERQSAVHLVISKGPEQQTNADTSDSSPLRTTVVTVSLPTDAPDNAEARIDVTDDNGKRTVYQQPRKPGDTLVATVQGNGDMTIEVYFGDRLVLTRKY